MALDMAPGRDRSVSPNDLTGIIDSISDTHVIFIGRIQVLEFSTLPEKGMKATIHTV